MFKGFSRVIEFEIKLEALADRLDRYDFTFGASIVLNTVMI